MCFDRGIYIRESTGDDFLLISPDDTDDTGDSAFEFLEALIPQ